MAKGSRNKTITIQLIQTFQHDIKPEKLYDCLQKMDDDLNSAYETLFEGPLPAVSGEKLILTKTPEANFPITTAFTDKENDFTENQTIEKDGATLTGKMNGGVKPFHIQAVSDGDVIWSNGIYYGDDNAFNVEDGGTGALLRFTNALISFWQVVQNIVTKPFQITNLGTFLFGEPKNVKDAGNNDGNYGDFIVKNGWTLRACRVGTPFATLPVIDMDLNDLIGLGSNPVGSTTGEGNIAIPRAVATDLPAASGSRNGIIIIDSTNNRLCYYVNGQRFKLAIGTAF